MGESGRIFEVSLYVLGALELELGLDGDGNDVLESGGDEMRESRDGRISDLESDGADSLETSGEHLHDVVWSEREEGGRIDESSIEDGLDCCSVGERHDVELIEESCFGGSDLLTFLDEMDTGDDLDLSFDDLGRYVEGLKERGLSRLHTGWSRLDEHILRWNSSDLCWRLLFVGFCDLLDVAEVSIGEDQSDVSSDGGEESLDSCSFLVSCLIAFLDIITNGLSDQGVSSKEKDSVSSEDLSDLLDAVCSDVVDCDQQNLLILSQQFGEFLCEYGLLSFLACFWHICEFNFYL